MSMKSEGSGKGYCLYQCLQLPICVKLEDCLGVVFCEVVCGNGCKLAVACVEHALIVNTGLSAGMPPENIANVLPLVSCFEKSAVMAQSFTAGSYTHAQGDKPWTTYAPVGYSDSKQLSRK